MEGGGSESGPDGGVLKGGALATMGWSGARAFSDRLAAALSAARRRLLELQHTDGHWCAELEGDSILESEYVLLLHYLRRSTDPRVAKAANYLRSKQVSTGGWTIYPGGPPDVSASVKAYFVLKLVGDRPDAPHMRRARETILDLGGLDACNSFTKLYLSIFGQYDWDQAPAVPPELILFPSWFPFNIYEMSSWSRAIVVPLSIVWALKPRCRVPDHCGIDELKVEGGTRGFESPLRGSKGRVWARVFLLIDFVQRLLEKLRVRPLRRVALHRAERWILNRLQDSDGLGAIFPPIINTLIAFDALGYPQGDPVFESQMSELEKLVIEEDDAVRLQPCKSPVWDTSLALGALAEAETGLVVDAPELLRAGEWLLGKEVRRAGDWRVKNPRGPIAGWYFEYANEFYPDCDDTAEVLKALGKIDLPAWLQERAEGAKERGISWLLSMQNRDGGWASFDRGCDKEYLTYIPFADHNAMIDPSTVDITSRVLETLAGYGFERSDSVVRRGVDFMSALKAVGEDTTQPWARKAVGWIQSSQNPDGGWGELPHSYDDPAAKGQGPSTAAQTAWALMGLLAAGEGASESVERGLEFLLTTQRSDGSWEDVWWTGTGFPKVFYLRYHYYSVYFPLLALTLVRNRTELEERESRVA
jgi:squalene-hopene/tetraprenyl-beta-curcumene cyclase